MAGRHTQTCALAGFLNVFGDAWSLMVVREALYGTTRFSDFQRNTGAARNLLSERLNTLVEHGILEKVNIASKGERYAYQLTTKGHSLKPLLAAVITWSNEHLYPEGSAPNRVVDSATGTDLQGFTLTPAQTQQCETIKVIAGPGASDAARKRLGKLT